MKEERMTLGQIITEARQLYKSNYSLVGIDEKVQREAILLAFLVAQHVKQELKKKRDIDSIGPEIAAPIVAAMQIGRRLAQNDTLTNT